PAPAEYRPRHCLSTTVRAIWERTTDRAILSMTMSETMQPGPARHRKQRSDGERTRRSILRAAASMATVDGLEGLSIGNLAAAIGMSKSGLYAHFGSKQELQLATVAEAGRIFAEEVVQPALAAPPGLGQ